ncbi:site-specific DNA-methyltransferase [Mannheimia pernigra]|uniref:site-specific DNA-methyltransferase n=1 Tax=Mannheimia pernigra TaxID=111844 RepID=UPI00131649D6|nr:DNA methyltransferase [Mannheimia pernigra]QHB17339.1 site-specific DNA-methyltransferase [Mannheimia pernigra]
MTGLLDLLKTHHPELFDKEGNFKLTDFQTALTQADTAFSQETYRLDWRGKSYAKALVYDENRTLLSANHAHNAQHSDSQNILIQGDNLAVLKHLREAYRKKIKMIYIDPPYNTGSDGFVYQDDRKYTPAQIAQITGESVEYAEYIHGFINAKASSHSAWLTFMYPRLKIARDLLKDDGVIFISIDDNEQAQLKLLCDEIFGEGNFVGQIANINNPKGRSDQKSIATSHEYILVYQKNSELVLNGFKAEEHITKRYNKEDENGTWREIDLRKTGDNDLATDRPNMFYPFYWNEQKQILSLEKQENSIEIYPMKESDIQGCWRWGKETALTNIKNLFARYMPNKKQWSVFEKDYFDETGLIKSTSHWSFKDVNSERGTETLVKELDFQKGIFPKPKPLGTIQRCIQLGSNPNDIILDFFAGSGTTAHAVMQLNSEDFLNGKQGNRQFICVQLDEPVKDKSEAQKAGFNTIFDITKARIEKSIEKIKKENPDFQGDLGFKEYKLVPTPDNFGVLADNPQHGLALLENLHLSDTDCQNILTTWCVQDGMPLHHTPQAVDLGGYFAYRYDTVLYLLDKGFDTSHLATILRRLDDTKDDFNIEKIVILEPHFDSKAQRELFEAVNQYKPRKGNKLYFVQRNRADKG